MLEHMRIDSTRCFILQTDLNQAMNKSTFKRLYIGYNMLKHGFMQGCRKIIGFDGIF